MAQVRSLVFLGFAIFGHLKRSVSVHATMPLPIIPYNPKLKERARQLRRNMTLGEVILWKHLKGKQMRGYDFDRQRPIDQFIVDFYCKKLRLAIEIDGSSHDSESAQIKDQERQARLESLGVKFLQFRDEAVRDRPEAVVGTIEDWVRQNEPTPSPSEEGNEL